jgi:serine phosphatase RsbU (regulator of sigma subunit)
MLMQSNALLEEIPYEDLRKAYHQLEKKNKDLIDGLYYAAFVQQGLLPQARHFRKLNRPWFVIYNPLQIIGGDFFWIGKKGDLCIYAVGDCTGHGVSGAMLSSLAIGFLNYLVYSKEFESPGEILNELDKKWIETFNRNEDEEVNNDWMEISLVIFNERNSMLQFSGAGGSIILAEGGTTRKLKGASYPVGGWQIEQHRTFETHMLPVAEPLNLYLYSDGYKDQFGGTERKRLGHKRFSDIIGDSAHMSCQDQKTLLEEKLLIWKGSDEQTDDVCVLRIDL